LVYNGPHAEGVALMLPTGGRITARHGEPVDIPDSVAAGLLEQGTWEKAGSETVKKRDSGPQVEKGGE
jgi:hypothetical protein